MTRTYPRKWREGSRLRPDSPTVIVAMLLAAALLTGCGGSGDREGDDGGDPGSGDDATDDSSDATGDPSGEYSSAIDTAVADAAAHFDVDPDGISVTVAEGVTWPDSSLGCPEPGQMYTQALVEGYRILLEIDGETVAYHGETDGEPRRCDDPSEPAG